MEEMFFQKWRIYQAWLMFSMLTLFNIMLMDEIALEDDIIFDVVGNVIRMSRIEQTFYLSYIALNVVLIVGNILYCRSITTYVKTTIRRSR